jgi:hypothetical protein
MININGDKYNFSGNVTINGNRVFSNGKEITNLKNIDQKNISIVIESSIEKLDVDACDMITVKGNCGSVKTMSGDVDCSGDIQGSVKTMSGDVSCSGSIQGSVSTMSGDIG